MAAFVWEPKLGETLWKEGKGWGVGGVPQAAPPTAADDATFPSGGASCTIDTTGATCRSLEAASGYNKTLKLNANITLIIGTTTSNGGKCLKLNSEMTFTIASTSKIEFVANHSTTEEITTAGRIMPNLTFKSAANLAKWKLLDKLEMGSATTFIFTEGLIFETGNQELNIGSMEVNAAGGDVLKGGTSLIKIAGPSGTVLKFGSGHGEAAIGSATFEFTGTGSTAKKVKSFGTESFFGTIVVACEGVNFEESTKAKKWKLETAGKTTGATKFPKSLTITATESFTTNAKSGSEVLIESTTKGTKSKFKYEGGTLEGLDWLKLEDNEANDSTHYYAGANSTLTNCTNWKKEAAPAGAKTQAVSGSLSFAGAIPRATTHSLAGSLSFAGALSRTSAHALSAALSFAGTVGRASAHSLSAALSFAGTLPSRTVHQLTAALSFAGSLPRAAAHVLTASLSFAGNLGRASRHALTASLSFAGSLGARVGHALSATLSFAGSLVTGGAFVKPVTASLSFAGSLSRRTGHKLAATLTPSGKLSRSVSHPLIASLSFSANAGRRVRHSLGASLSFTGRLILPFIQALKARISLRSTPQARIEITSQPIARIEVSSRPGARIEVTSE